MIESPAPSAVPEPVAAPDPVPSGWYARLSRPARWVFWATVLGGLFRVCFVAFVHQPWKLDWSDMHNYISAAEHFADPHRPTDAGDWYYPSGTGAMIALWLVVFGKAKGFILAGLFQALLSTAVIPLTYVAGKRFFDARIGATAAVAYAVHYLPIGFAGMFMSETYLTIGLALALALFDPERPSRAFAGGLALGFGAWAKSQAFLIAPLWALVLLWDRRWKAAVALMVGVLLWVVPISVVASKKAGVPSFISANGGQTFALGQCPFRTMIFRHPTENWAVYWSAPDLNQRTPRGEPEAAWQDATFNVPFNNSRYYMRVGFDCIRRYPKNALRSLFFHLSDTFSGPPWSNIVPWPDSAAGYVVPAAASNWLLAYLVAPLAFIGFWLQRRSRGMWFAFALPVFSLLFTAAMFHGDPRFRVPFDAMFLLAGAAGFYGLRERRRAKRASVDGVDAAVHG